MKRFFNNLRHWLTKKVLALKTPPPIKIQSYISYANQKEIIMRGRVIEDLGIISNHHDGHWENFVNNIKRMTVDKAKYTPVKLHYEQTSYHCLTDDEGYFNFRIPGPNEFNEKPSLKELHVTLSLPNHYDKQGAAIQTEGLIFQSSPKTQFVIVTDIDDTILQSHVDSFLKLRLLYETFFKNANERIPFENIGKVLGRISCNENGEAINPIFYISHSPWNLYSLLCTFLVKNDIPLGPFFLRDFGAQWSSRKYEYAHHKLLSITHLCEFYDSIPFVLIGDATENDIDIYIQIAKKFTNRIQHIIIRATENESRNMRVKELMAVYRELSIHLIYRSEEILEIILPTTI